jgi:hypothetical protein
MTTAPPSKSAELYRNVTLSDMVSGAWLWMAPPVRP